MCVNVLIIIQGFVVIPEQVSHLRAGILVTGRHPYHIPCTRRKGMYRSRCQWGTTPMHSMHPHPKATSTQDKHHRNIHSKGSTLVMPRIHSNNGDEVVAMLLVVPSLWIYTKQWLTFHDYCCIIR